MRATLRAVQRCAAVHVCHCSPTVDLTLAPAAGFVRRACIPKELTDGLKDKGAQQEKQAEKHVAQLEAALREAAGAIQRHDKEMKKMIDRLQELEAQQKELGETSGSGNTSVMSPSKSEGRTHVFSPVPDSREVQEERQKSYLVGATVHQTVDLSAATVQKGEHSSVRSKSQSTTPMAVVPPHTMAKGASNKNGKDFGMSPLTSSSTADTSPAPGPASVAASLHASANGSPQDSGFATPQYPMGARTSSDEANLADQRYGTDLYKDGSNSGSIIFAGPGSNAGSQAGPDTIAQDDMIVKADIGFSNKNGHMPGAQTSFWSAMTDNINLRSVPLLSLGQLTTNQEASKQEKEKRERERSLSRERERARAYARSNQSQSSNPSSREATPPRTPGKATPASLSAPGTPTMKGYTPVNGGGGFSARGTPHGHIGTALPSPHGSAQSSARGRRQGSSLVASGPLSARGINPERHPALHEKELAEMMRLVEMHCQVMGAVGSPVASPSCFVLMHLVVNRSSGYT